jgi:hypothetical protein
VAAIGQLFDWEREFVRNLILTGALVCALAAGTSSAQSLEPLKTFGGGDGWVAPGERTYLNSSGHNQRGLAYNPATGNLLVVHHSGAQLSINKLNGITGADAGTLSLTGVQTIGTGFFPLNMIAATEGGRIYAANLADTSTAQFRIYRWESEADTTAQQIHRSDSVGRLGDTLDARVSEFPGMDYLLVGQAPNAGAPPTAYNGYTLFHAEGGEAFALGGTHFAGTPPNPGDHRLGITFLSGNNVAGTQNGPVRVSTYSTNQGSGEGATLTASPSLTTATERPMDHALVNGIPVLATVDTASSLVRVYNFANPAAPTLLASGENITGASNLNDFGVGQVRFGPIEGNYATLYALNANNGIQAFTFIVPEPGTALLLLGLPALILHRGRRC